jgi:hypothetical protein
LLAITVEIPGGHGVAELVTRGIAGNLHFLPRATESGAESAGVGRKRLQFPREVLTGFVEIDLARIRRIAIRSLVLFIMLS